VLWPTQSSPPVRGLLPECGRNLHLRRLLEPGRESRLSSTLSDSFPHFYTFLTVWFAMLLFNSHALTTPFAIGFVSLVCVSFSMSSHINNNNPSPITLIPRPPQHILFPDTLPFRLPSLRSRPIPLIFNLLSHPSLTHPIHTFTYCFSIRIFIIRFQVSTFSFGFALSPFPTMVYCRPYCLYNPLLVYLSLSS